MDGWPGELLRLAIPLALLTTFIAWAWRGGRRPARHDLEEDQPEGVPYGIYTTEHDADLDAVEALEHVLERNRGKPDSAAASIGGWPERIAERNRFLVSLRSQWEQDCAACIEAIASAVVKPSILLLLDQSGSMRDRILGYGAALQWLYEELARHGLAVMVAGFTTSEWQGGQPRRDWIAHGRPRWPGRLCPVLYVRYAEFDRPASTADWNVMAHPAMLHENIDGEALLWAENVLSCRRTGPKILVFLSDGAPVDDSTLASNGPSILDRHLRDVVATIEAKKSVHFHAIGLDHEVDEYYRRSTFIETSEALPAAVLDAIEEALAADIPSRTGDEGNAP